ncbi:hypothetical protein [Nocardia farcinica]|uniref:hypothetical protein n=1 Tax=Nocardia farcinica TaxID=37329 RepID=UPI002456F1FB|nr:hypothetical protein [Nocardia farcinica]
MVRGIRTGGGGGGGGTTPPPAEKNKTTEHALGFGLERNLDGNAELIERTREQP